MKVERLQETNKRNHNICRLIAIELSFYKKVAIWVMRKSLKTLRSKAMIHPPAVNVANQFWRRNKSKKMIVMRRRPNGKSCTLV